MRKFFTLVALMSVFIITGAAQKPSAPVRSTKPAANSTLTVKEISATDWKILTNALNAEDWTKAAGIAALYAGRLKTDNDKKQLARLRYLRLYALAGKILAVPSANVPVDKDALWKELDDAASRASGKELILPPHEYQSDCQKRVNYICRVTGDDRALRVTATNREGTAIHSFDYVVFDDRNALNNLPAGELFLGGVLKKIEYNQDASKPWVMRLIFEKGFVNSANK